MSDFTLKNKYQLLLLIFFGLAVYYPSLFAEVCTVDDTRLINDLFNQGPLDVGKLFFPGHSGYYYRPLTILTFHFDKYLWGFQPLFMHMENILLHVVNTVLVYFLGRRFLGHGETSFWPFVAALLFCLHPINTESINWISGRTDPLVGVFLLGSFVVLLRALDGASIFNCAMVSVLFFVATLAKDVAIFWMPAAMLMVLVFPETGEKAGIFFRLNWRRLKTKVVPLLAIAIVPPVYFAWRAVAFAGGDTGVGAATKAILAAPGGSGASDYGEKLFIAFKTYGFYLKKIVWPFPLNFGIVQISDWYVVLGIGGVFLTLWMLWRLNLAGALLIMCCSLFAPALLVSTGKMAWTPFAERYLYLASAPYALAVVMMARQFSMRSEKVRVPLQLFGVIVLGLFCTGTAQRNLIWQHNLSLFQDTQEKSPDFPPAQYELAVALLKEGRQQEAADLLSRLKLPAQSRYNIVVDLVKARELADRGDYFAAREVFSGKSYSPQSPDFESYVNTRININNHIIAQGSDENFARSLREENIGLIEQTLTNTSDPFVSYKLGKFLYGLNDREKALEYFRYARDHAPEDSHYRKPAARFVEKIETITHARD